MNRWKLMDQAGEDGADLGGGETTAAVETGGQGSTGPETLLEALHEGLKPAAEESDATAKTGAERDENGRFTAKKQEVDDATNKPADPAAVPASKADDDDLTMPEGLSEKAQERFRKLAGRVHEYGEAYQQAQKTVDEFRQVITATGATPQEFSQALDYLRAMKSGDMDTALRMVENQRRQISLALGRPLPGADVLAQFPDLRQRVDSYQMDEQAALEIARARVMQHQRMQQEQAYQATTQRQQAIEQERAQAIGQIDQLGLQWAKADPDYAAKEEVIRMQLPAIAQQFPPSMWAHQVRMLYDTISAMPMQAPARTAPAPLRASGQSAGARQPGSMLEALQAGLGYSQR